jgi:hypothetical protein
MMMARSLLRLKGCNPIAVARQRLKQRERNGSRLMSQCAERHNVRNFTTFNCVPIARQNYAFACNTITENINENLFTHIFSVFLFGSEREKSRFQ